MKQNKLSASGIQDHQHVLKWKMSMTMAQKKNPNRGRLANDLYRIIFELKYTQNIKFGEIYPQMTFSSQI